VDMREGAELIYLTAADYEKRQESIRKRGTALCEKHPLYQM
jgi:hypothetical protein